MTLEKVYIVAEDWTMWETEHSRNRQFYPTETHLVGWLVQDQKDHIVIALEWIPSPYGDDLRHILSIPRKCVHRVMKLKDGEWDESH